MSRRFAGLAGLALVGTLLLSGCAPQYTDPDDRSASFGAAVAAELKDLQPHPDEVRVRGDYDGISLDIQLGDMSFDDSRAFIESALPIIQDSPLGAMPVRFVLSHEATPSGGGGLEWRGYDPARADRYFGALQLWFDILADPGVKVDEPFQLEAAKVWGSITVLDGRDPDLYRADLLARLAQIGYADPYLAVAAAKS